MLEEYGVVVAIENKFALIQMQRTGGCLNCTANEGCGVASLSLVFGKKDTLLKVNSHNNIEVGDKVKLGLDEQALLKSSLLLYLLPLFGLFVGAIGYDILATLAILPNSEILTVMAGLIGLGIGLKGVKLITVKFFENKHYQPVILK